MYYTFAIEINRKKQSKALTQLYEKDIYRSFITTHYFNILHKKQKYNVFSPKFEKTRHFLTNKVDSALYMLMDIKDSINTYYKDPYFVNEYHILLAEAQFKNQIKQANHKEVEQATKFYDSLFNIYKKDKNLSFQTARALWITKYNLKEETTQKLKYK